MNKVRKAMLTALTVFCLLLPQMAVSADNSAVWAYAAAVESGNLQDIVTTVEALNSIHPSPADVSECKAMLWPAYNAGFAYEKLGNFTKALEYYRKFVAYASYLQTYDNQDHRENIKGISAIVNHLSLTPQLYAESAAPADVPQYGAKNEPAGTFFGKCDSFSAGQESAYLLYITFGTESVATFDYLLPDESVYLEIAWNLPNENKSDLDGVNSGAYDNYMIENLKHIATLRHKVFLRFGAEVNCWSLPEDPAALAAFIDSYKAAFRRVAGLARQYAPNAALVYSPNDVSAWHVTAADFYPGDEYVDWVGLSMYDNVNPAAKFQKADTHDAYYCLGYYDNPIVKIKNIVDTFGDRKPIMISECGFAYDDGAEAHAVEKLKEFYTYVNMVYPQVKGILYFNANVGKTYKLDGSAAVRNAFMEATRKNAAMQASLTGRNKGYTRFSTVNEQLDTLKLALYADFPSPDAVSVSYTLDGVGLAHEETIPYRASIDVKSLTLGQHTLTVAVSCGSFYQTYDYVFYVGANNYVCQSEAAMNAAPRDITVLLDGSPMTFAQPPVIIGDRTLVPLRAIFEALGATVDWTAETQTVQADRGDTRISLQIGSNQLFVNGAVRELDVPAQLYNGYTMVPSRAIAEALGCTVDWDGSSRTVIITR
ncbi:MAG: stalk domain-containing protein [Clostridia bacterium]